MNFYIQGFIESVHVASIIPFSNEPTFAAMKGFGTYDMTLAFILASVGATLGHIFNWWVGKFLLKLKNEGKLTVPQYWYELVKVNFNKYGLFLLLFAWVPLCNVLVVLSGFVDSSFRRVLPLVTVGVTAYYAFALL